MNLDLSHLNKEQIKPVLDTEGAVLVTAGAGSGKTRLLTHRIAHIINDLGVPSYNVLAITFTNKAANEMKERLLGMVDNSSGLWVSTIHSLCVLIMRKYIHLLGYSSSFSIYDESERRSTIKKAVEGISKNESMPERINSALSAIKNSGMDIEEYIEIHKYLPNIKEIGLCLYEYEKVMRNSNAFDFDDLLVFAYKIVYQFQEAREYYQNRFRYIHVDEFQDTNTIQYLLVKILAQKHKNIFIVGDEDQSIYGWRGANIENIKKFVSDFSPKMYKLQQNYRSTKKIIELANNVIKNNNQRIDKVLWTDNDEGEKPILFNANTESDEADFVMQTIKGLNARGEKYNNIAVLMRINSLSRIIEQKFMFYGIPYRLYGGFKFYDRKEIKDFLAYLKVLSNPLDNEACSRILSFPKKGIGDASISKIIQLSNETNISVFNLILSLLDKQETAIKNAVLDSLPKALVNKLQIFAQQLQSFLENKNIPVSMLLKYIYQLLKIDEILSNDTEENESKRLNIKELINSVVITEQQNPNLTLDDYVQQIMLYSDLQNDDSSFDCVNVATIHSAKGLEYNTVFAIGLEEGIFPLSRALESISETEEERRLMYVAITRAKRKLFLTYTNARYLYGKLSPSTPSRFLQEARLMIPYKKKQETNERIKPINQFQYNIPKPLKSNSVDITQLKIGQKIKHKRLGEGIIKSLNLMSNESQIEFKAGIMTLNLNFAPISIVEEEF